MHSLQCRGFGPLSAVEGNHIQPSVDTKKPSRTASPVCILYDLPRASFGFFLQFTGTKPRGPHMRKGPIQSLQDPAFWLVALR